MVWGHSITDLLSIVTALVCGGLVYLLVRWLWPQTLLEIVAKRLEVAYGDSVDGSPSGGPVPPAGKLSAPRAFGAALVFKLGKLNRPLVAKAWGERMQRRFLAVGRPDMRPEEFIAQQELYGLLFALLGLVLTYLLAGERWGAGGHTASVVLFGLFGALFPHIWLKDQTTRRRRAIVGALPYHLDLLTLSVEAGLDFSQALSTVVERGQQGPLVEELGILVSEMKLGKTREQALRNLAARVQVPEVASFTANLIQSEKMGTSLGKVLRIQSAQLRIARAQHAEKAANEAPVKMLLPLVLCFFPTVFIILFGPIVYRMMYGG